MNTVGCPSIFKFGPPTTSISVNMYKGSKYLMRPTSHSLPPLPS